jgi:hypothetical protein
MVSLTLPLQELVLVMMYTCSDFNYVRSGNDCVPVGPEPIPAGMCPPGGKDTYMGSSGWRKIPGNTCTGGTKDEKVEKKCSQGQPAEGEVIHQTVRLLFAHFEFALIKQLQFEFQSAIVQHAYFKESTVSTLTESSTKSHFCTDDSSPSS